MPDLFFKNALEQQVSLLLLATIFSSLVGQYPTHLVAILFVCPNKFLVQIDTLLAFFGQV